MLPDLDNVIDRSNTDSEKWNFNREIFGVDDVLPMWVADMDFAAPPAVSEALIARAEHPIYGYSRPDDEYYDAVIGWMKRRQHWEIKKEWIMYSPGIVTAINLFIQTYSNPGDKVIIQPPVYHPFAHAVRNNGRQIVNNPLRLKDGKYSMDYEDLEQKADDPRVKMIILCNPHNPVGRVWTQDELVQLGGICLKRNIIIVSDEIHSDFIYKGYQHTPFASITPEFEQGSIVCNAPSKTFNLAGLQVSNIIIPNEFLRNAFHTALVNDSIEGPNCFAIPALKAAYRHGEAWLNAVMDYVAANYHFLKEYVRENLPQIKVLQMEGTYLAWMDFSALGMTPEEEKEFLLKKAKVALNGGTMFGVEGQGFQRMNIVCPRSILKEGLDRIKKAVSQIS